MHSVVTFLHKSRDKFYLQLDAIENTPEVAEQQATSAENPTGEGEAAAAAVDADAEPTADEDAAGNTRVHTVSQVFF